jgi:hypothetical protein
MRKDPHHDFDAVSPCCEEVECVDGLLYDNPMLVLLKTLF